MWKPNKAIFYTKGVKFVKHLAYIDKDGIFKHYTIS